MRVPFVLKSSQSFSFPIEGATYGYPNVDHLAGKHNFAANIEEAVVETPDGKKVWNTIVGDEEHASPLGIERGWHVAQVLSGESAAVLVKAFTVIAGKG